VAAQTGFGTTIDVTGGGTAVKTVTITLHGYTSLATPTSQTESYFGSAEMGLMLVSPSGRNMEILRCVGDGNTGENNITVTLEDGATAAPNCQTAMTAWTSGTYAPGSYPTDEIEPNYTQAGAPALLHSAATNGTSTLNSVNGVFTGDAINGNWKLYLVSDAFFETDVQFSSWDISITYTSASMPSTTTLTPSTTTAFTSGGNSSVTLTATVTSGATGTVTFQEGATNLTCSQGNPVTLSGGTAQCTTTFSTEGYQSLSATYSGDNTYVGSSGTAGVFTYNHATSTGTTYCNAGTISSPGSVDVAPYPSVIYVGDGVNTNLAGDSVSTVSLKLSNFSSDDPDGLHMLLVSPDGTHTLEFWGDAGGGFSSSGTYTLQDGSSLIPQAGSGGLPSGTYGPTAEYNFLTFTLGVPFPAPAPQPPASFSLAAPAGSATFESSFVGATANGAWLLYVSNEGYVPPPNVPTPTDTTASMKWCIDITPGTGHATTVTVQANPTQATKGASVTFTATVTSNPAVGNTGQVTFTENGAPLNGAPNGGVANVSNGVATISTTSLPEGDHTVTALYHDSTGTYNDNFGTVTMRVDAATSTPTPSGSTWSYCNAAGITIPAGTVFTNDIGPAAPNPSNIFVTNLPGTIGTATLTMVGFHVQIPGDLESLLVGPNGSSAPAARQTLDFFSPNDGNNLAAFTAQTVTFADIYSPIPANANYGTTVGTQVGPTSNGATSYTASQFYTLPSTHQYATTQGHFTLDTGTYEAGTGGGVYTGTEPNGTWSLYFDQTTHETGDGASSWCMNFIENPVTVTVTEGHSGTGTSGDFVVGETGAQITTVVTNNGTGSTGDPDGNHPLKLTDNLNTAFTYTGFSGTDWSCSANLQVVTCVNHDAIAQGSSYPTLTITVNVAANASTPIGNTADVSGGGVTNNSGSDSITVDQPPILAISKSHLGTFTQGQTATWTLQVTNNGTTSAAATNGTMVTVYDPLPGSYTLASGTGTNWSCGGTNPVTCTTSQVVAGAGGTFSALTLNVNVPTTSAVSVSNTAYVYGGGDLTHYSQGTAASGSDSNVPVVQVATSNTANAGTTPQSAVVNQQFTNALAVTVKDANGVAVPNQQVTFTPPSSGASGLFTAVISSTLTCTTTSCVATTNSLGVATASAFTANTTAGSYTVKALINGLEADFSLTNNPGSPATITITNNSNSQAVTVATAFQPLQVNVTDSNGNHVLAGVSVTFTAPSTGASGKFSTSNTQSFNTDGSGNISAPFTANTVAGGPYSVTLACTGVSSPPSFSLTNNPGPPSQIVINSGNNQAVTVGSAFAALQITVEDSYGNPVGAGTGVTFTAPSSGASGTFTASYTTTLQTMANGTISASFTSNHIAGAYSVTLASTGITSPPSFSLTDNPGPPSQIAIAGGNSQAVAVGTAFAPLQITVEDSYGNPVGAGTGVTFTAPGSGASGIFTASNSYAATLQTAANGTISAAFTANHTPGSYSVLLSSTGITSPPSFSLTDNPGPPSQIVINSGNSQAVTVGLAFQPLQITVEDSYGNPVGAGTGVTFTAPSSGASGNFIASNNTTTLPTLANGIISASFTSNHIAGAYSVTLASTGITSPPSFSLTDNPGPPSQIAITGGNSQAVAVGTAFAPLQITVEDSYGNPVGAGTGVTFTAPGSGASGIFTASNSYASTLQTAANGTVSAAFTANHIPGSYSVTLSSTGITSPPSFSLTNNPGPPSQIVINSGNNQAVTVGSAFQPLQITIEDSYGNPVGAGTGVTFTAPSSGASGTFTASYTTTLQTTANGTISASFTSNHIAGAYSVTLASTGINSPPSFSLTDNPGPPSQIAIAGGNSQAVAVGTAFAPLQITVEDSYGNPVGAGTGVTFTAPASGASGTFTSSGTNSATLQTAANGAISAAFTANHIPGSYSVLLSSTGITSPPSFSLTNNPGPAASISITGGNNQSVTINTAFTALQILVQDAYGNPVAAGTGVTFTAPGTGASGVFANSSNAATLQTVSGGTISAAFTANLTAGSYSVTLSTNGVSSPPSFTLTNLPGPPAKILITNGNNQAVTIGAAFAPLQIEVTDIGNNPLSGINVLFTAPASGPSGAFANNQNTITLATLSNGTISAPFTANLLGGVYNVTLTCSGVNSPPAFSLQNNAANVSGSVSVSWGGYSVNHGTHVWTATMTVTNNTGAAIAGPVQVLLTGLTSGVNMSNASGTHGSIPFITVTTGPLAAGAQANIEIQFQNPNSYSIQFTPVTYSGGLVP
jgi:hypothetical protein